MTTTDRTTRRVYSAEQLHKLRGSCSAPKLREAIEEHEREDAELVKEHVLRGSKSFAARSFRSRAHASSIHFPQHKSNDENIAVFVDANQDPPPPVIASSKPQVLGKIANNGQVPRALPWRMRTSPTPSIRKSRIEALVKDHGSPQHVRVTAGGRIVPSEQSPLCHPRFGYSAIKSNGALIKVAPNHVGKTQQWISTTQDGYVAQDESGRLCQIVNGMILPLNEDNGAVRLYVPAPNLNITQRGPSAGAPLVFQNSALHESHQDDMQGALVGSAQPTVATQKNALELEYSKLEQDLKDLDKTEVLHGGTMAKAAKDALFTKRRELVTGMDRVRKALKSLRELPSDVPVPTSPKAMRDRQSMSPQRDRLPPFLQRTRQANGVGVSSMQNPWQNLGHPLFDQHPTMQTGAPFNVPNMLVTNASYSALPYQMPPPGAFMPPPPFDGTMGAPFSPYPEPVPAGSTGTAAEPRTHTSDSMQPERTIPQQDGSSSASELKVSPPRQSRALPIRDPETRQVTNVKSILNPMSPVYKPSNGMRQEEPLLREGNGLDQMQARGPTPLNFMHSSRPVARASSGTGHDCQTSPAKKKVAVDGSSVSSVRTADFFPRNTRDYSMRKHEYPIPASDSEDKENIGSEDYHRIHTESHSPITPKRDLHNTNWNPDIPDGAFVKFTSPQTESYAPPTVPPGTPVNGNGDEQRQPALRIRGAAWDDQLQYLNTAQMPDRVAHNLSPKNKRTYRFIEEHPSRYGSEENSSPVREHQCREEMCVTASPYDAVDFTDKSRDWIEGHQAGLYRKPIGPDRIGDFVDGYCAGLLKSQPVTTVSMAISDGSPARQSSRHPTPAPSQLTPSQGDRDASGMLAGRPPMELSLNSLDSLKQAVFAPQNENALMTPAAGSSIADETAHNLGGWQKRRENAANAATQQPCFSQRASSLTERQNNHMQQADRRRDSALDANHQKGISVTQELCFSHEPRAPNLSAAHPRIVSGSAQPNERVNSITSIDSTIYRPWPGIGPRIISPFDWKTPSSVAHAANLATGYFAQSQYDGTAMDLDTHGDAMLTYAAGIAGVPNANAHDASTSDGQCQRHSGSLDGMSSPANPRSPPNASPNLSPNASPRLLPARSKKGTESSSKKSSPTKSPSPAKVKFEHIASKVGISVSSEKKDPHDGSSPTKKRWKDIWHGSSKKGGSKDEGSSGPASPSR